MNPLKPLYKLFGYESPTGYEKVIMILFLVFILMLYAVILEGKEANKLRQEFNNYSYDVYFFCTYIYPNLVNGSDINVMDLIELGRGKNITLLNISYVGSK